MNSRAEITKEGKMIPRLVLAPMAGYSDAGMRRLASEMGVGMTVTEMVSVKGLYYGNKGTSELLIRSKSEKYACVQLFGSDAEIFRRVILDNELLKSFDMIDINMGCPVRKVVSNGDGSALLSDVKKAAGVVYAAAKSTSQPISVKYRIPPAESAYSASDLARIFADNGAKLLTLHGRTPSMLYSGKADWLAIRSAAANSPIPLIASGDVVSKSSSMNSHNATNSVSQNAEYMNTANTASQNIEYMNTDNSVSQNIEYMNTANTASQKADNTELQTTESQTNDNKNVGKKACSELARIFSDKSVQFPIPIEEMGDIYGVMIGRGAVGNLKIFAQIQGKQPILSIGETALRQLEYTVMYNGERYALSSMRKHLAAYAIHLPSQVRKSFKQQINLPLTLTELKNLIQECFLNTNLQH